jgi:ABC-type sulfate/molybdate transport systems ATPase subunit
MSALKVSRLSFLREGRTVLDDLDFELELGERVAILGRSGSGKTTLLRLIAGLETPDAGEIEIGDRLASRPGRVLIAPHARSLGFVFQEAALWPHMRVIDHLRFASPSPDQDAKDGAFDALLALTGLDGLADRYPDQLSGGEARRVGLARALAARPLCLLMDEPLTNLDHELRDQLLATIDRAVTQMKASLVYVTHEPIEARALASRVLQMADGKLGDSIETG